MIGLSKNQAKFVRSLHLKKNREKEKLFIAEGVKVVEELIASGMPLHGVYALPGTVLPVEAVTIDETQLRQISLLETPNRVLAVAHTPQRTFEDFSPAGLCLVLDNVRDPGNFGTIVRTADWFGVRDIVCLPGTVEAFGPKAVQASMGSLFRMRCYEADAAAVTATLKNAGCTICAAVMDGTGIGGFRFPETAAVVLGNESAGVGPEMLAAAGHRITVPHGPGSEAESLNVSVAAGILCYKYHADRSGGKP